jgi:N-carbamoyl-L-amino-acid hydrolase
MNTVSPDMDIAKRIFTRLESHWKTDGGHQGVYRPCYHHQEEEAIAACVEEATALELQVFRDIAGNVYLLLEGKNPALPVILSGSHVDSVPYGGRYDGTAGVVAAISAIEGIIKAGLSLDHGLCVMICRGEESAWFGQVSIGSKFAVGELSPDVLARQDSHHNNISLGDAMRVLKLSPEKLAKGKSLLPLENIASFVELHIEQGPMLARQNTVTGIVSGIRGNIRFPRIVCKGEAGHTGTVPHVMRKDAVRACSRLMAELEDYFLKLRSKRARIWSSPFQSSEPRRRHRLRLFPIIVKWPPKSAANRARC